MVNNASLRNSDQWLRDQLRILEIKSHKRPAEMAVLSGMSVASYYNRLRDPEEFRLKELRALDQLGRRFGVIILEGES